MNLVGSFSRILGRTMRMHMLTCENLTVGPKGLMTRSFTWGGEFLRWARTVLSAMQRCLSWPKGGDDAILYVRCYRSSHWVRMIRLAQKNSLGGPRQVVCCHAKMSRLARRNTLGGSKQVACCHTKMSRLARRSTFGRAKIVCTTLK
jgi:hypothetical protein